MQKILYSFFLGLASLVIFFIIYLSTFGIETSKFNNIIINEIKKKDQNIQLSLGKIKVKFDIQKIQIYLSTVEPNIIYQNIKIPIVEINLYTKIISILKSKNEINQATIDFKNFKINDIQQLAARIKPSNFKTYLLNNLDDGEFEKVFVDLKFGDNLNINDFKLNGSVKKVKVKSSNDILFKDVSFNFISDQKLTLINSLNAKYQDITITNGSFNLKRNQKIDIEGKFNTQFVINENSIKKLFTKSNLKFLDKLKLDAEGSLLHNFTIKINENLKLVDYDYNASGSISESQIILKDSFKNEFIDKPIKKFSSSNINLTINLNKKKDNLIIIDGLYNLGGLENKKFKISHDFNKKNPKYFIDFDLAENFYLKIINFKSNIVNKSNIKSELSFMNNNITLNNLKFTENKNLIYINGLKLNSNKELASISEVEIKTFYKDKLNNNFKISFKKKISITGSHYDATYLLNHLTSESKNNTFKKYTKDIEIKLKSIITKSQIPLNNFNLIGKIKNGKLEKLSSKGEFSNKEYLDITLKKDENNKKILEIYSDLPKAILGDYKFFEGINKGKLLYNLVYDDTGSASKMTIENFKVVKAPAFAKLLTLADLGGIADLLSGEGMSFDILEIYMKSDSNVNTVEEILVLGPSLSILMDGYIEKKSGLISLSGTLVPAKTLNSLISKIPVVGNILVGQKVGEGIFGVSFKIKGLPGKTKTTVNPVKTLTPRFITRALEKMKKDD